MQSSKYSINLHIYFILNHHDEELKARIKVIGLYISICEECDALWIEGSPIKNDNFIDYSTYVKVYGLRGIWSDLEILE